MPRPNPELELARYWRKRSSLEYSDFDRVLGDESDIHDQRPPPSRIHRRKAIDLDKQQIVKQIDEVCLYVALGLPLSEREFHLACAMGYLLTDLPYLVFYKTQWWETKDARGYANRPDDLPPCPEALEVGKESPSRKAQRLYSESLQAMQEAMGDPSRGVSPPVKADDWSQAPWKERDCDAPNP